MAISLARCGELEACYIDLICKALQAEVRVAGLWRTLFDPWYAYRLGPAFVKPRSECAVTFNPSDHRLYRKTIALLPYRSVSAGRILDGVDSGELVREHAVPIVYLRDRMLSWPLHDRSPHNVREFLVAHFRIGMITTEEHRRLGKFNSSMPDGWKPGDDLYARYAAVDPRIDVELSR